MHIFLTDILPEAFFDTLKTLPFLFGVYFLIEYIEHHASGKLGQTLQKLGPWGAVGGGFLGVIPQCGFSVAASNLYSGRIITAGTLVAVFISTSDEAIPIMLSTPEFLGDMWKLLLVKLIIGIIAGLMLDLILKRFFNKVHHEKPFKELCSHCGCEHHSILYSSLKHTLGTIIFIFAVNLILGSLLEFAGEERVSKILISNSIFQPFIAALIGFIPNCGASVVLTELYSNHVISFGSLVAGLSTGAGVGLPVLFKSNKHIKENLLIMLYMYITAVATGCLIQLFIH